MQRGNLTPHPVTKELVTQDAIEAYAIGLQAASMQAAHEVTADQLARKAKLDVEQEARASRDAAFRRMAELIAQHKVTFPPIPLTGEEHVRRPPEPWADGWMQDQWMLCAYQPYAYAPIDEHVIYRTYGLPNKVYLRRFAQVWPETAELIGLKA